MYKVFSAEFAWLINSSPTVNYLFESLLIIEIYY